MPIHDNQRTNILQTAEKIDEKARERISQILAESQAELLAELSPQQRQVAVALLGTPIYYRETMSQVPNQEDANKGKSK